MLGLGFAFNKAILHEFVLTGAGAHVPGTASATELFFRQKM